MKPKKNHKCKVKCTVGDCSYHDNDLCHAQSVTIGDHGRPMCDTFCLSSKHGGNDRTVATVGACKVENCMNNQNLLCRRQYIMVGPKDADFYCLSYKARMPALQT